MRAIALVFAAVALVQLMAGGTAMAQEQPDAQSSPEVSIRFIYIACNDLEAMREFYTNLLGMPEMSYSNEGDMRWLMYQCGTVEFLIFPGYSELPVPDEFSAQPGWAGGKLDLPSWSVNVPADQFAHKVASLTEAGVPTFFDKPEWCQGSYWSYPVRDPMGNTVEVYTVPAERPESTDWQE